LLELQYADEQTLSSIIVNTTQQQGANPPTSGSAWIHGMHVVADRAELRQSLGVCPQFDVNYDYTSVRQQLLLYGAMTGMTEEQAQAESTQLLTDLHLLDKADELAGKLSGGQKRRLSLAVSLIGSPSVVLVSFSV
jgi:ABC-type multidrug transport system ATPase subunit